MRVAAGVHEYAPLSLPDNSVDTVVVVDIMVQRSTTLTPTRLSDPDLFIEVDTYASFDGGNSWVYAGGFGAWGGVHRRKDGSDAPVSSMRVAYPDGKNRLMKHTVTVSKPTDVTITITPRIIQHGRPTLR